MKKAMRHPPIVAKFPHFLHGGDYNPDQWIKWKDTVWKEVETKEKTITLAPWEALIMESKIREIHRVHT